MVLDFGYFTFVVCFVRFGFMLFVLFGVVMLLFVCWVLGLWWCIWIWWRLFGFLCLGWWRIVLLCRFNLGCLIVLSGSFALILVSFILDVWFGICGFVYSRWFVCLLVCGVVWFSCVSVLLVVRFTCVFGFVFFGGFCLCRFGCCLRLTFTLIWIGGCVRFAGSLLVWIAYYWCRAGSVTLRIGLKFLIFV